MTEHDDTFRCALTPLIKACCWEMDVLKAEIRTCNSLLSLLALESEKLALALAEANEDVMRHNVRDSIIVVQQREISCRFIAHLGDQLQTKRGEIDKAAAERTGIALLLEKKRIELRGLEMKRDARKVAFEYDLRAREQRESDNLWLVISRESRRG